VVFEGAEWWGCSVLGFELVVGWLVGWPVWAGLIAGLGALCEMDLWMR
jgi:hypothetical protein